MEQVERSLALQAVLNGASLRPSRSTAKSREQEDKVVHTAWQGFASNVVLDPRQSRVKDPHI
jgi:hypothetical protein